MRRILALALCLAAAPAPAAVTQVPGLPRLAAALEGALTAATVLPGAAALPALPPALPALDAGAAGRDPRLAVFLERLREVTSAAPAAEAAVAPVAVPAFLEKVSAALGTLTPEQIRDMPAEGLSQVSARVWEDARVSQSAGEDLLGPGRFDPAEGLADLERLEALNEELAAGGLTAADLEARGLVRPGSAVVTRGRPGEPGGDQVMPFRELLLPAARTGLYAPTKLGPVKDYQGLLVVMPGIGADVSTAKGVLDLALTFSKAKKDAVLDDVEGKRVRLITFALDATMNGLGEGAPFSFASARGSAAVLRHAVLVLKILHPGLPAFVAGRSQGGLIALDFAARHGEAAGVVALNPSHPEREIVLDTVRTHELEPKAILGKQKYVLHERAWTAYKHFTPGFGFLERPSRAKVLMLLGKNDPSYPQPLYVDSLRGFAARQARDRRAEVFDLPAGVSHNLWNRAEESVYRQAILAMARFFLKSLP